MMSIWSLVLNRASRRIPVMILLILAAAAILGGLGSIFGTLPVWASRPLEVLSAFTTVFLGIFIEAAPFLLLGTIASGVVEIFFGPGELACWVPKNRIMSALSGSLLGMFFPVCECGVVPLSRRMAQKGLPVPAAVAFVLGAPVLNPIVIASTLSAFGWGPVFWGRLGLSWLVAVLTGISFSFLPNPERFLKIPFEVQPPLIQLIPPQKASLKDRWQRVMVIASDEFFEMGRYLTLGALLAAGMQTIVPQSFFTAINRGAILPVLAMMALAVLLSICSTVDAFIALAFTSVFSTGSILAFLVFGPMVDIKSTLMFLRAFERRKVVVLILLPLLATAVLAIFWNLILPG
jgi:uncharacterized protein